MRGENVGTVVATGGRVTGVSVRLTRGGEEKEGVPREVLSVEKRLLSTDASERDPPEIAPMGKELLSPLRGNGSIFWPPNDISVGGVFEGSILPKEITKKTTKKTGNHVVWWYENNIKV